MLSSVMLRRRHPMYRPLKYSTTVAFIKKRNEKKFIITVVEFIIVILFIIVITKVTNVYWNPIMVYSNTHLNTMTVGLSKTGTVHLPAVFNRSHLEDCLQYIFGDSETVYNTRWYNGMSSKLPNFDKSPRSWTGDLIWTPFNTPYLRQVRVIRNSCVLATVFKNTSLECVPLWSLNVEDTGIYKKLWQPITRPIETWESDKPSVWGYSCRNSTPFYFIESPTGIVYPSGGFVAKLSLNKIKTRIIILELINDRWIDRLTRALFVQFTLYNVNINVFTSVSLIAEHLPYGVILTRTLTESVQQGVFDIPWTASLLLILLIFFVKAFFGINSMGISKYLSNLVNAYQALLFCLGTSSIAFFIVHVVRSMRYVREFNLQSEENPFMFSKLVIYQNVSLLLVTALLCCLAIRLLSLLWLFGREFSITYTAFKTSATRVVVVFFIALVLVFIYKQMINYLLNHFPNESIALLTSFIVLEDAENITSEALSLSTCMCIKFLSMLVIVLMINNLRTHCKKKTLQNS